MNSRHWMTLSLVLIVALATAGISGPIFAQDGEPEAPVIDKWGQHTLVGVINVDEDDNIILYPAVDDDTWDGTEFIFIAPAGNMNPSRIVPGSTVEIVGFWLNETTVKAVSLKILTMADAPVQDDDEREKWEDDDEDKDDWDDEDICGSNVHPVLATAAQVFAELGVTYEDLIDLHCDGTSVGDIIKMLQLANSLDKTFDEIWTTYQELGNWGAMMKEYGLQPSTLAPGQAKKATGSDAPGKSGDAPGRNK